MLWSFIIILPITVLSFLAMVYLNGMEKITMPEYYSGWLLVLNFVLCVPPFLMLVIKDYRDEDVSTKEGIVFFLKQMGLVLLFSSLLYLIAVWGMIIFFIPTIIAFLFILIFPFFTEIKNMKEILRRTALKIADENIALIGDILVVISLNIAIWAAIMAVIQQFDNNIIAFLLIRVVMNMIVFPLLYIYLTLRYREENEFSSVSYDSRNEDF